MRRGLRRSDLSVRFITKTDISTSFQAGNSSFNELGPRAADCLLERGGWKAGKENKENEGHSRNSICVEAML